MAHRNKPGLCSGKDLFGIATTSHVTSKWLGGPIPTTAICYETQPFPLFLIKLPSKFMIFVGTLTTRHDAGVDVGLLFGKSVCFLI